MYNRPCLNIIAAMLFFAVNLLPCEAPACCGEKPPVEIAFARTDCIVVGRLISIEEIILCGGPNGYNHGSRRMTFELLHSFKGNNIGATIDIYTFAEGHLYASNFTVGLAYVVYAKARMVGEVGTIELGELPVEELLFTRICTRNDRVCKSELEELNKFTSFVMPPEDICALLES